MQNLDGLYVGLHGLGPLNWVVKRMLLGIIQENITNILLFNGREIIRYTTHKYCTITVNNKLGLSCAKLKLS